MHLLIVLGSPRKNGNSEILAQHVAKGMEDGGGTVEYIRLGGLTISPCQGCGGCEKTGECVIKDDMGAIYERADAADRILVASPVYFYALTAQTKAFIDRFQARWSRRYLLDNRFRMEEGRKGYLLSVAATKGAKVFDCSLLTMRYFYEAMDMAFADSFLLKGVDQRGAVRNFPEELVRAEAFGRDIAIGAH
ncbi:flavodoxin family protein [Desulfoprunum benzoelyticum]|uniref:Multimeric flavodoxin WrbA n=1 Tax=Desulfoprunum benzoelyticum TaxID=1506996 RepID=A0A840V0R3_9BACT|nr:flavodoxin family protein [Desulfoprunum benzoelyticum]MBB5347410.1 multimeric flavodoxin WrbA [Desulfoprunum benzoelyticum]MBM9530915.1 flavodoxin family protein [Desulfoprunum benzoelyticum]